MSNSMQALFSTGLFKFSEPAPGRMVSPEFWIYWAVTIPVTCFLAVVWIFWVKRSQRGEVLKSGEESSLYDEEAGLNVESNQLRDLEKNSSRVSRGYVPPGHIMGC